MIDVLLVDDHSIVRQGIKSILEKETDFNVVGEAGDGREAVELSKTKMPDVVVMDITLPNLNGLEASLQILKNDSKIKILVLSMHDNRVFIEKALSYGIKGYILKESASQEIVKGIKEVYEGRYFLSSRISSFVIQDYIAKNKKTIKFRAFSMLTSREKEVLQLLAEGLNNKEIAKTLDLSLKTALVHRNNIMQKLDIHNNAKLIRFAIKEGISSL